MRFAHPGLKSGQVHADGESYPIKNGVVDVPPAIGRQAGWTPVGAGPAPAAEAPEPEAEPGAEAPPATKTRRRKKGQDGQ